MAARFACAGLTGGRGALTAFRDVDLAVSEGEVLAVLGPNGAGKTTLLLTLAGLLDAQGGEVAVDGTALRRGRPAAANRAGVVLVPDERSLFTELTVEENLRVAARRRRADPRQVLDVFPALQPRWGLRAGSLSGGEQQMLALARAMVQAPRVLLIDELSMGLAPLVVESLFGAIRNIADDRRCAVVIVEQHVGLAIGCADSVAVLSRGQVVLRESAAVLRQDAALLENAYLGDGVAVAVADGAS